MAAPSFDGLVVLSSHPGTGTAPINEFVDAAGMAYPVVWIQIVDFGTAGNEGPVIRTPVGAFDIRRIASRIAQAGVTAPLFVSDTPVSTTVVPAFAGAPLVAIVPPVPATGREAARRRALCRAAGVVVAIGAAEEHRAGATPWEPGTDPVPILDAAVVQRSPGTAVYEGLAAELSRRAGDARRLYAAALEGHDQVARNAAGRGLLRTAAGPDDRLEAARAIGKLAAGPNAVQAALLAEARSLVDRGDLNAAGRCLGERWPADEGPFEVDRLQTLVMLRILGGDVAGADAVVDARPDGSRILARGLAATLDRTGLITEEHVGAVRRLLIEAGHLDLLTPRTLQAAWRNGGGAEFVREILEADHGSLDDATDMVARVCLARSTMSSSPEEAAALLDEVLRRAGPTSPSAEPAHGGIYRSATAYRSALESTLVASRAAAAIESGDIDKAIAISSAGPEPEQALAHAVVRAAESDSPAPGIAALVERYVLGTGFGAELSPRSIQAAWRDAADGSVTMARLVESGVLTPPSELVARTCMARSLATTDPGEARSLLQDVIARAGAPAPGEPPAHPGIYQSARTYLEALPS